MTSSSGHVIALDQSGARKSTKLAECTTGKCENKSAGLMRLLAFLEVKRNQTFQISAFCGGEMTSRN